MGNFSYYIWSCIPNTRDTYLLPKFRWVKNFQFVEEYKPIEGDR